MHVAIDRLLVLFSQGRNIGNIGGQVPRIDKVGLRHSNTRFQDRAQKLITSSSAWIRG